MKKLVSILAMMVFTTTAFGMTQMPEGKYVGQANWKDKLGNSGTYKKETNITSDLVASIYQYTGTNQKYDFEAPIDAQGYFPVRVGGKEVGSGYCMNVQCHYSVDLGGTVIEETFTFKGDNLYVVGSKTIGDKVIAWEEALIKESK